MKNLELKGTNTTPEVSLNAGKGELTFSGRSIPEDPGSFFTKILDWIEEYYKDSDRGLAAEFTLEYVNSGSSKYFLEIIRTLNGHHLKGKESRITWLYEEDDESIQELGELFQSTVELPFDIKDIIM
jgi:hypothetical protein